MSGHKTKALVQHVRGMTFIGKANSNHWVTMDADKEFNGQDGGARPMELVLLGLGGCTAMDVISILEKKKTQITDFRIELEADHAPQYPKVFTHITLVYYFYGKNIKDEDVKRAIELSETKYCSVQAMLRQSCSIQTRFEIVNQG